MRLEKLIITNFAGIDHLEIHPGDDLTISGPNGSRKSTIANAYAWCLTGKDMKDRQNFNIKNTADKDRNRNPHEVTAILDGKKFKRVYLEKWVTPRGQEEPVFQGNETAYFIDDLPTTATDYAAEVEKIAPAEKFKLVSIPGFFTSQNWRDQRRMLMEMAGVVEVEAPQEVLDLIQAKGEDQARDYLQKTIRSKKEKIKDHRAKIDENERNLPPREDWEDMEDQAAALRIEREVEQGKLADARATWEAKNKKLLDAYAKKKGAYMAYRDKVTKLELEAGSAAYRAKNLTEEIGRLRIEIDKPAPEAPKADEAKISLLKAELEAARQRWREINAEEFVWEPNETTCKYCAQELPEKMLEHSREIHQKAFDDDKKRRLAALARKGEDLKLEIENEEQRPLKSTVVEDWKREQAIKEKKVEELEIKRLEFFRQEKELLKQREEVTPVDEPKFEKAEGEPAKESAKIDELNSRISALDTKLGRREIYDRMTARTDELKSELETTMGEVAKLERTMFALLKYINDKMEAVTKSLNHKFKYVRWRLFTKQANGGYADHCEATWRGVDYSALSTGEKMVVDMDIINAMSEHYGLSLPVFIDNAEAITLPIETKSQLIRLKVAETEDGSLTYL